MQRDARAGDCLPKKDLDLADRGNGPSVALRWCRMNTSLEITVGQGRKNPIGKLCSITFNGEGRVVALFEEMRTMPSVVDGWWSGHLFDGNHRQAAKWKGASCAMVDVDYHAGDTKKPSPSDDDRDRIVAAARAGRLPGSIFHPTPHGARVIFVFDQIESDPEKTERAIAGAGELVQAALAQLGLAETPARQVVNGKICRGHGFAVDSQAQDRARFMFSPRAIVDGEHRNAELLAMSSSPYSSAELAAAVPTSAAPPGPAARTATSRSSTTATDLDKAVARWNADHRLSLPRDSAACPVCEDDHSFGHLPDDDQRWFCFSTDHPESVGVRGPKGFHGDALDLEAHARGLARAEILRADGYLAAICGCPTRGGKKCASVVLFSDGKCVFHSESPEAKAERRAAGRTKTRRGAGSRSASIRRRGGRRETDHPNRHRREARRRRGDCCARILLRHLLSRRVACHNRS